MRHALLAPPPGLRLPSGPAPATAGGLGAATVVLTLTRQVPLHGRLSAGWDAAVASRLLRTNRTRTAVWTASSAVALALLVRA